jgi:hypothetical protein
MDTDWTDDIELVLNKIRINSLKLSEYHRRNYLNLKNKIKYFRVPVLCLSSINSVFSVGLNAFVAQSTVSVLNCLISLVCGIIVSVELFLQVQSRMDSSNSHSKDFYILTVDIFKTLSLDRSNRKCEAHTYMEEKYAEYCKYKSGSALLSIHLRDELESIPINKQQQIYGLPAPPAPSGPTNVDYSAIDIDYYPEFPTEPKSKPGSRPNSRQTSRKSSGALAETPLSIVETPLSIVDSPMSVADVLPEIPTRAASLSITTRTPGGSRASSRRPSAEKLEITVRDTESGEVVVI